MKIFLLVSISALLGIVFGTSITLADLGWLVWGAGNRYNHAVEAPPLAVEQPDEKSESAVTLQEDVYDFGVMERGQRGNHVFLLKNAGQGELVLRKGISTCTCTFSEVPDQVVLPGETAEVKITWEVKSSGSRFRESATIFTNDSNRGLVELFVVGQIIEPLYVEPSSLVFSKVIFGQGSEASVRVVCFREQPLELLDHKFLMEKTARFFDLAVEPIAKKDLDNAQARSGLLLTVKIASGMPMGRFEQQLQITTNVEQEKEEILPIRGRVESNISIFGRGWSDDRGALLLGGVKRDQGTRRELTIFVRGDQKESVQMEIARVHPDVLRVSLGKPTQIKNGPTTVPLIVEVPPGSRAINCLGTEQNDPGEIMIRTNVPQAKKLSLSVIFAVEG